VNDKNRCKVFSVCFLENTCSTFSFVLGSENGIKIYIPAFLSIIGLYPLVYIVTCTEHVEVSKRIFRSSKFFSLKAVEALI
jgi:hypothetical protein